MKIFAIFFVMVFLGTVFAMSLDFVHSKKFDPSQNMGYDFKYFFMALVLIPVGGGMSLVATLIAGSTRHSYWTVAIVSFASGMAFFCGIILAAICGIPWLFAVVPPTFYILTSLLLRLPKIPLHRDQ